MLAHRNNIGFLRLVLASAVIVGHAPELIDGNRSREPLKAILPYSSMGSLAVSAFFLLSGYLITASMLKEKALAPYLERRLLRIVPGYLVAYLLSVFVMAPLFAVDLARHAEEALVNMMFLKAPPVMPELGLHEPSVNGALWTIAYEFRCYLLVAILWRIGLLDKRRWIVAFAVAALALTVASGFWQVSHILDIPAHIRWFDLPFGAPVESVGFIATFLVGALFYLYRAEILPRLNWVVALVSLLVAALCFHERHLAPLGRALFVAAPVFWLAFKANLGPLRNINDRWDISYGTYLYGWPVSTAILLLVPNIGVIALMLGSLPPAWLLGALSWHLVEKRAKALPWRKRRTAATA